MSNTPAWKMDMLRMIEQQARAMKQNRMLGSGGVWEEVVESDISTKLILSDVPRHWPLLWGIDFGIAHRSRPCCSPGIATPIRSTSWTPSRYPGKSR
jgi:hypothetical protein